MLYRCFIFRILAAAAAASKNTERASERNTFSTCTDSAIYFAFWLLLLMTVAACCLPACCRCCCCCWLLAWCVLLAQSKRIVQIHKEWNTRRGNITQINSHFTFCLLTKSNSQTEVFSHLITRHDYIFEFRLRSVQWRTQHHIYLFIWIQILIANFSERKKTPTRCYFKMKKKQIVLSLKISF